MLNRSSLCFRAGLLLIVVGVVFSLPSFVAYTDLVPELGEGWRSPAGVALGAIAVVGGLAMAALAFRLRRREREGMKERRDGGAGGR